MTTRRNLPALAVLLLALAMTQARTAASIGDEVLFDFESGTYDGWTVEGEAFGKAPLNAAREVPQWREDRRFAGYQGNYIATVGETRHERVPPGKLTSRAFTITRDYLNFYLGGEVHPRVRVALLVDGSETRTTYGNNSYDMRLRGWDVREFKGKQARILIEAAADVHELIRVDHFYLSDAAPPPFGQFDESRQESDLVRYGEMKLIFKADPGQLIHYSTVVQGPDKRWRLYATVSPLADRYKPQNHRTIIYATSNSLTAPNWTKQPNAMTANEKFGEQFLWDPFVVVERGVFYMFYVGAGKPWAGWQPCGEGPPVVTYQGKGMCGEQGPFDLFLAVSKDGQNWERRGKLFSDAPFGFTPFALRVNGQWRVYYASAEPANVRGKHIIAYRTSKDLQTWSERRIALKDASTTTPWPELSYVRSPLVLERGKHWYLLAGPITNYNQARFHYLRIYRNDTPDGWDVTRDHKGLFLEGGAKIVRDGSKWFVTHSGVYAGGVWVAPLFWKDGVK